MIDPRPVVCVQGKLKQTQFMKDKQKNRSIKQVGFMLSEHKEASIFMLFVTHLECNSEDEYSKNKSAKCPVPKHLWRKARR